MLIRHKNLRAIVRAICTAAGSEGDEPAMVADNLVDANLTGHDSHGVGMLPRYISCVHNGELKPNQHVSVTKDEGTILMLEGNHGYGQVIGREAMAMGIERARRHGENLVERKGEPLGMKPESLRKHMPEIGAEA